MMSSPLYRLGSELLEKIGLETCLDAALSLISLIQYINNLTFIEYFQSDTNPSVNIQIQIQELI